MVIESFIDWLVTIMSSSSIVITAGHQSESPTTINTIHLSFVHWLALGRLQPIRSIKHDQTRDQVISSRLPGIYPKYKRKNDWVGQTGRGIIIPQIDSGWLSRLRSDSVWGEKTYSRLCWSKSEFASQSPSGLHLSLFQKSVCRLTTCLSVLFHPQLTCDKLTELLIFTEILANLFRVTVPIPYQWLVI